MLIGYVVSSTMVTLVNLVLTVSDWSIIRNIALASTPGNQ